MLDILLYISLISGGILTLSLLLSLFAGLDLDMDFDVSDGGGLGIMKSGLTFLSIGAYVVRSMLMTSDNPIAAFVVGIMAGGLAVFILSLFLRWLIRNEEEVNYSNEDAVYKTGSVYLKIPRKGTGIIQVSINGVNRELKALSSKGIEIPTGQEVRVEDVQDNVAHVILLQK